MKPYYEDGSVTIYHGDSLEVIPSLPLVDVTRNRWTIGAKIDRAPLA